jgi:hypothetical protein
MTSCPQCGAMNDSDVKNCRACRVNLYWAFQHYDELATIRERAQLKPKPETPAFLVDASERIDAGPTVGWLRSTINKFGLKEAGKKVSTMAE